MKSMIVMMSENQLCRSQVHVTAFRVLKVKRQKVGLNKQLKAHTAGGAWFSPNAESLDREMDNQHNNHEGSSRRPGALLEIYNIFHTTAVHQIFIYIIIF
jgi:hypothetical protein